MYNETGNKIKGWAVGCAIFEILSYIIAGIILIGIFVYDAIMVPISKSVFPGFVLLAILFAGLYVSIVCSIRAWRKHLLMAGFGELIEKTCEISAQLAEMKEEKKAEQTKQSIASEEASSDIYTEYYSTETDTLNLEAAKAETSDAPKWKILRQCLEQGLITEEEYEKKMQELYK